MTGNPPPSVAKRLRRAPHVAWRRIGDETVVLDLKAKRAYGLNGPGGTLWQALVGFPDGGLTARAFSPSDPETRAFLAELAGLGLVEEEAVGSPDPPTPLSGGSSGAPRVTWSDEIRAFGGTCGHIPGQGGGCNTFPQQ